jgi:hypothetical protein
MTTISLVTMTDDRDFDKCRSLEYRTGITDLLSTTMDIDVLLSLVSCLVVSSVGQQGI